MRQSTGAIVVALDADMKVEGAAYHVLEMLSEYRSEELSAIKLKEASDLLKQGRDSQEAMIDRQQQWTCKRKSNGSHVMHQSSR